MICCGKSDKPSANVRETATESLPAADCSTQDMVAGTLRTSPAWSGKAGSGWVPSAYSGITLPAGKYKTTVWSPGGAPFFNEVVFYFGASLATGGRDRRRRAELAAGTLVRSNSTYQDNDSSNMGKFRYPYSFDSKDNGENRWVDVEVTPA
jgi:hypothetical protein